ncbi:MAG: phosphodiester glycosidase family protein [Opitutales bacterium]|nr:phosphodiester glycosidase family protein [Opitutales bacterium]
MKKIIISIFTYFFFLALSFATPFWQTGTFDWSNAETKYDGVLAMKSFVETSPRPIRLYAVRLQLDKIGIVQTPKAEGWGRAMPDYPKKTIQTARSTTRDFVKSLMAESQKNGKDMKIIFACNTSPWSPFNNRIAHKYANFSGMVVSGGEFVSRGGNDAASYPIFYLDKQGKYGIRVPDKYEHLSLYKEAIFAFGTLLDNGKTFDELPKTHHAVRRHSHTKKTNPLIAIGFDKAKKYLYIVGCEGRMPTYSEGMFGQELARAMRYFGAYDAVLMDGGGSTTMLVVDQNTKKIVRLNKHNGEDKERSVALNLAFYLK